MHHLIFGLPWSLVDLRRGPRDACPPGVQILSNTCSFWENLAKSCVGTPPGGLAPPPRGNPGSATDNLVRINRAWLFLEPKVSVLEANIKFRLVCEKLCCCLDPLLIYLLSHPNGFLRCSRGLLVPVSFTSTWQLFYKTKTLHCWLISIVISCTR